MRRAAKRDANEPAIVEAMKRRGWKVRHLSADGLPDLMCTKGKRLRWLEVKSKGGKLTPAQEETFPAFWAAGLDLRVVRSVVEALAE